MWIGVGVLWFKISFDEMNTTYNRYYSMNQSSAYSALLTMMYGIIDLPVEKAYNFGVFNKHWLPRY